MYLVSSHSWKGQTYFRKSNIVHIAFYTTYFLIDLTYHILNRTIISYRQRLFIWGYIYTNKIIFQDKTRELSKEKNSYSTHWKRELRKRKIKEREKVKNSCLTKRIKCVKKNRTFWESFIRAFISFWRFYRKYCILPIFKRENIHFLLFVVSLLYWEK